MRRRVLRWHEGRGSFTCAIPFASSLLVAVAMTIQVITAQTMDFGYYDRLRQSDLSTFQRRDGNVDVFRVTNSTMGDEEELGLCHLVGIVGFTVRKNGTLTKREPDVYKDMVAALLAVQHFNTGNGSVVPELNGIDRVCPVRFTGVEYMDTQFTIFKGLSDLTDVATRDAEKGEVPACAVLGSERSTVTQSTSTLSSVHNLTQMSYSATSPELEKATRYPYFARVVPSDASGAVALIVYLHALGVRHLSVLFVNDSFGQNYALSLRRYATQMGFEDVELHPLPTVANDQYTFREPLESVRMQDYRYVVAVMYGEQYDRIMTAAYDAGVVGQNGFQWFFAGGSIQDLLQGRSLPEGSALEVASRNVGVFHETAGRPEVPVYEAFTEAWHTLDDDDVQYFNSMVPMAPKDARFQAEAGFFQNEAPTTVSGYAYDTVVAMGLASCRVMKELNGDRIPFHPTSARTLQSKRGVQWGNLTYFYGPEQHKSIINGPAFQGVTGVVNIDNQTRTRVAQSAIYTLANVVPRETQDGKVTLEVVDILALLPNVDGTDWEVKDFNEFVFIDGSTTPPPDLPPVQVDMNYLGGLVVVGGFLCAIIMASSLGFAVWTLHNRTTRVVRASQMPFLLLVCTGTLITVSTIIPLSIGDDRHSFEACSMACRASPWLLALGNLTCISAFFSKTWRLSRIRRNPEGYERLKVSAADFLVPFLVVFIVDFVALLAWSISAPLHWQRQSMSYDHFDRPIASVGRCRGMTSGKAIPYMGVIVCVNICFLILANIMAYMARNILTEYNESKFLAIILYSTLEIILLGIPLIFIMAGNPEPAYLIGVVVLVVLTGSMLFFIFIPKIYYLRKERQENEDREEFRRRRLSRRQQSQLGVEGPIEVPPDDEEVDDANDGLKIAFIDDNLIDDMFSTRPHNDSDENRAPKKPLSEVLNAANAAWE